MDTAPSQAASPVQDKPDEPSPSSSLSASSIFFLGASGSITQHHQQQQQQPSQQQQQQVKKCVFHRQCCRNHPTTNQQQQDLQKRIIGGVTNSPTAAPSSGAPRTPYTRDAISTNVQPQYNAALIADRYLLMDQVEGSTMYKCLDVRTQEELVCKIANNPCSNLLTAHFRLDGHQHVNYLNKVIRGTNQTYLYFSPSQGDLHSHVRVRKRLRENEARQLFRQMCEVVKTCHEEGIVLRDLKLRKFVFADAERTHLKLESLEDAVVLDNPAEDLLQDKRGCPAYVSPEILKANTQYSGKAADMWSLGVILYTMLVGRYPFNDSEHASLFAKISRGQFIVPECLSSKARCIIRALLRRDPDERITSEDVLHHPWLKQDESREYQCKSIAQNIDDQCVPEWSSSTSTSGTTTLDDSE